MKDGSRMEQKAGNKVIDEPTTAAELLQTTQINEPAYRSYQQADPTTKYLYGETMDRPIPEDLPDWVKYDRMVLRYYMWFEESMPESRFETRVIRKCILYYYLCDKTIHIGEPHEINSGMPQGVILRRFRYTHPNGHNFDLNDFMIGKSFWLLGHEYHIVDVDDQTRNWYDEVLKNPQPAPDVYPDRPYAEELGRSGKPPIKLPVESICGPRKKDTLRQFLDYDRKVLRFTACWDDRDKLNGDKRNFILLYYLADDCIEVLEIKVRNNGRDPFPKLLRKMKLLKPEVIGQDREYYTDRDLIVGTTVYVFNRPMLLLDCDPFTRKFFQKTFSIDQPTLQTTEEHFKWPEAPLPQYTGFGSEEDSLASHYNLIPKVPWKDYKKMVDDAKKLLRYSAVFANPKVEDKDRKFIIIYYLGTDLVQIYEPPVRNSGIIGGKFLQRGRYYNTEPEEGGPPRPFKPSDFDTGKEVSFTFLPETEKQSVRFRITGSDRYTDKYWDGVISDRPLDESEEIQLKLIMKIRYTLIQIPEVFRVNDPRYTRVMTVSLFKDIISSLGVEPGFLTDEDVDLLLNKYTRDDGLIHYDDFFDSIACSIPPEDSNHLDGRLQTICRILYDNNIPIRRLMRESGKDNGGYMNKADFMEFMNKFELIENIAPEDFEQLLSLYMENGNVKWEFFLDDVYHFLDRPPRITMPEYKPVNTAKTRKPPTKKW